MLLLPTNDAKLIVVKKCGKGFEPLRKYAVADSPTWAHPVILDYGILIKDATTLALWDTERLVIRNEETKDWLLVS